MSPIWILISNVPASLIERVRGSSGVSIAAVEATVVPASSSTVMSAKSE